MSPNGGDWNMTVQALVATVSMLVEEIKDLDARIKALEQSKN